MPQRANALRVAPIFGPRYVAKLVRSAAATACAWLLAIFRKLTATWHTWVFQQSLRITINMNDQRLHVADNRASPALARISQTWRLILLIIWPPADSSSRNRSPWICLGSMKAKLANRSFFR
jgi:hypothetical protein